MRVLNLYTTLGCHLCDEAAVMVSKQQSSDVTLALVEISESAALMEKYAIRIPVLKFKTGDSNESVDVGLDTDAELAWPFTEEELAVFLSDS
jgi:hypothetical protein